MGIRTSLATGANIRSVDEAFERTPLHHAAVAGHAHVIGVLVQHGAPINAMDQHSYTPLHLAAERGHHKSVNVLLEHHASLVARTSTGSVALHFACYNGYIECAHSLLAAMIRDGMVTQGSNAFGAVCDFRGQTPLDIARESGVAGLLARLEEATQAPIGSEESANAMTAATGAAPNGKGEAGGMRAKWLAPPEAVEIQAFHRKIHASIAELNKPHLELRQRALDSNDCRVLAHLSSAGHLPKIRMLDLRDNAVGDTGIQAIGQAATKGAMHALEVLCLGANVIGDVGLASLSTSLLSNLSTLAGVTELDLSGNVITGVSLRTFAAALQASALPHLAKLDLSGNPIGGTGLQTLVDMALPFARALRELSLNNCFIGNDGVQTTFKSYQKGGDGAGSVVPTDTGGAGVDEADPVRGDGGERRRSRRRRKQTLDSDSEAQGKKVASSPLSRLEVLRLNQNSIGSSGMAALAQACLHVGPLPLRTLWLGDNHIGDAGLRALAEALTAGALPKLEVLLLFSNQLSDAASIILVNAALATAWQRCEDATGLRNRRELISPTLGKALAKKTTLRKDEWVALDLPELNLDNFVKVPLHNASYEPAGSALSQMRSLCLQNNPQMTRPGKDEVKVLAATWFENGQVYF